MIRNNIYKIMTEKQKTRYYKDTEHFTDICEDFDMSITVDKDEEDVAVLVESLKNCQTLDPYVRKEAFSALRTLLSNKKSTQDFFRELQGVELMISIYQDGKNQKDLEVMENALFTLGVAVEKNDVSRNALLTPELFKLIKGTMKRKSTSSLTSAFLLLCLVSNSGDGQTLARKTKCIHKLCELLKETIVDSNGTEQFCKITNAICSTLCAVNIDPINETNQGVCCGLIMPSIVRWLYSDISRHSLHSLISLLGSCINGNSKTKTQLRLVGGLRAMFGVLDKYSSTEEVQSTEDICLLTQLINTFSCSYVSHEANQLHAIELGAVEVLLSCLVNAGIQHAQLQKTCITALVSLLDNEDYELGKQKFQDHKGVPVLIEIMAASQDEKLKKLVTFLLHKMCSNEGFNTQPSSDVLSKQAMTDLCTNTTDNVYGETRKSTLERDQSQNLDCASRNLLIKETVDENNVSLVNFSKKRDDDSSKTTLHEHFENGHEKKSLECRCKSTIDVDSHTVLTVLLMHSDVCEYHKAIGHALQAYITRKKELLAASVE
ncbi:telomere repeats-binding bouquet formation protein 1-like [Actinia tenebrosa]|uniref:Telomere repeats-binding bouquet formation protein 1-like n=1 Tax=Actinia tenebrosa TaxID=6105 RepID=A0A6P8J4L8_ACTTE|nr:telomere repeats-binding bouquet formation protein 1-like [Actinia tenebrosa]